MNGKSGTGIRFIHNPGYRQEIKPDLLSCGDTENIRRLYETMDEYALTPLVRLRGLAKALGVKEIFLKDESFRLGLKSFKGLGGMYALIRIICDRLNLEPEKISFSDLMTPQVREQIRDMVFVAATDGNHGKGVAWAAKRLGCRSYIFMPRGSTENRAQAIRNAGASGVRILDGGYDDTVRYVSALAEKNGWQLVQDTSWKGYEKIPRWIAQGYTIMAAEAAEQLEAAGAGVPTHVFLQAGVGSMAGGVMSCLIHRYREQCPVFSIVEPSTIPCIYESVKAKDGVPHTAEENGMTIMAGLNCGEPCTVTWPVLRDYSSWLFACEDFVTALGMKLLAEPFEGDASVVSGESGAVTTGLLALLGKEKELQKVREDMGLDENAVILLFNTEGDTDAERYREIVYEGLYPSSDRKLEEIKNSWRKEERNEGL